MENIFNRNRDPRTAEEFMIAECMQRKVELEQADKKIEDLESQLSITRQQMEEMCAAFKETDRKRDERLRHIEERDTGIIDMHQECPMHYMEVWSKSGVQTYARNASKDSKDLTPISVLEALLAMDDESLVAFEAEKYSYYYNTKAIKIRSIRGRYSLSIPWENERKRLIYDPQNSRTQLIEFTRKVDLDIWTNADIEELKAYGIKELRARIQHALEELEAEAAAEEVGE